MEKASPPLSLAHLYSTGEEAGGRPGARREGGCNDASGKERAQLSDQERRKERKITQMGDIENVVDWWCKHEGRVAKKMMEGKLKLLH